MKKGTAVFAALVLGWFGHEAAAQTARQDIIWARDVGSATLTLDGKLDEPQWQQAERIPIKWGQNSGLPGSGRKIEGGTLVDPPDPTDAVLYVLRQGNKVWLGTSVPDKSIGGGRGLQAGNWFFDGLIFNIMRRGAPSATDPNYFGGPGNTEFIYSWWNPADTLAGGNPIPGLKPRAFGNFGCDFNEGLPCVIRADTTKWNYRTQVQGTVSDDSGAPDTGYTMEQMIDLGQMGYDFSQLGGDRAMWNIAVQDADYRWPVDATTTFTTRTWWQNQWANNFIHGAAYIVGAPGVTTTSGAVPMVGPDLRIAGSPTATVTVDGRLNEGIWGQLSNAFSLKYRDATVLATVPGGVTSARYFRPTNTSDLPAAAQVVDPSTGRFKMFYKGDVLYVGVDVDDAAISGAASTDLLDGVRLSFHTRRPDSLGTWLTRVAMDFSIDSTGAVRIGGGALGINANNPGAITAGLYLKPTSTAADPSDVDTGYQMEIAIDLVKALGYPAGRGDGVIWPTALLFDADLLEDAGASTSTRTWFLRENTDGPGAWGYLDPALVVGVDDVAEVPGVIALQGAFPNPSSHGTTFAYTLPRPGHVAIDVFDVLGRRVAAVEPGVLGAGTQRTAFAAEGLAAGVYVYRIHVRGADGGPDASVAGRLVLSR